MTESTMIAEEIYDIEHADLAQKKEWEITNKKVWSISPMFKLKKSDDYMMWYILKYYPNESRGFVKVVLASSLNKETIVSILDAQPWVCI